jgi:hypothetical protein
MHQATVEQQPFEMTHCQRHLFDGLRESLEALLHLPTSVLAIATYPVWRAI